MAAKVKTPKVRRMTTQNDGGFDKNFNWVPNPRHDVVRKLFPDRTHSYSSHEADQKAISRRAEGKKTNKMGEVKTRS